MSPIRFGYEALELRNGGSDYFGKGVLKDISQPNFEANPPDGVLAVPLLRHQSWPGLPRGVEFNPSDSDLLWHLAAEVGNALAERHPFINEFIKFVDDVREFICTHPQHIPGVRQDGRASYFFHRSFEPYINENDVNNCWKKIGSHISIILDGTLMGCKEVFALYADMPSDKRSQETDWRLHQYHLQNTVKAESEIVASKIFLASRNSLCELAKETHIESEWWKETVGDESREFGRYMRQREEQEKQEAELFTRAPVTKHDKQIEKRIRRQLHGISK
ncbi:NAC domain-containing protein 8 [Zea mays]|uniref:NAC domain-containing protein 8 n=1 Tax=Zea mays TaxID=4577 RepID=A0A1D6JSL3_MAIZE|nr:NAC domain-containing protein 8 [Zea mays]